MVGGRDRCRLIVRVGKRFERPAAALRWRTPYTRWSATPGPIPVDAGRLFDAHSTW